MNPVTIGPSHKRWKPNCGNFSQVIIYDNVERGRVVEHFTGINAKLDANDFLRKNALCQKEVLNLNTLAMMVPESTVVVDQATG